MFVFLSLVICVYGGLWTVFARTSVGHLVVESLTDIVALGIYSSMCVDFS